MAEDADRIAQSAAGFRDAMRKDRMTFEHWSVLARGHAAEFAEEANRRGLAFTRTLPWGPKRALRPRRSVQFWQVAVSYAATEFNAYVAVLRDGSLATVTRAVGGEEYLSDLSEPSHVNQYTEARLRECFVKALARVS